MLISEHIESLMKILNEKGDQELFMWVDTGDDTVYMAKVPELKIEEIDGNEFQVPHTMRNQNGNVIIITNLDNSSFDEEVESIQDLDLEVTETEEEDNKNG